jgi:hypothetical protein
MKRLGFWIYFLAVFGWIAATYYALLPSTVQMGDTGELVAAALKLFVPHPPGYPLFVWIQHAFLTGFDFGSVFFRASLLNAVFSILALVLVWLSFKEKKYLALGFVGLLAFSRIFWRFSEVPDVFAFHGLFACAVLYLYFEDDGKSKWTALMPLIFSLGLAHHHTLVFLAPLVLDTLWRHRNEKKYYLSLGLGVIGFVGLYGSLVWMNPQSLYSWGNMSSAGDVIGHFLRRDYGTFQLLNSGQESSLAKNWSRLASETFYAFYPLILAVIVFALLRMRFRWQRKDKFLCLSLVFYALIFFTLANVSQTGFLVEVFDRFMILFQILLLFVLGRIIIQIKTTRFVEPVLSLILILVTASQFFLWRDANDFSQNTVVEDYVVNLLNQARTSSPSVLLIGSDTRFFAARYAQTVLGVHPEVFVASPKGLLFPWFARKLTTASHLRFDEEKVSRVQRLDLQSDFILPNLQKFEFITPLVFTDTALYQITILPLGRRITLGNGVAIDIEAYKSLQVRSAGDVLKSNFKNYDVFRELLSDYSMSSMIQGLELKRQNRIPEAVAVFQQTLAKIPWCFPAATELCQLGACHPTVQDLREKYFDYY